MFLNWQYESKKIVRWSQIRFDELTFAMKNPTENIIVIAYTSIIDNMKNK